MSSATDILTRSYNLRPQFDELDELRAQHDALTRKLDPATRREFHEKLDMSWIYHDSALEGQVLTPAEIWTAINTQVKTDSNFQHSLVEIRNAKVAIEFVRSLLDKKKITVGPELVRRLYNTLASEEDQFAGALLYRKEIPIHRTYFHEIAQPARLAQNMKGFFEWARDPMNRKMHPVYLGCSIHYRLMRIFPFTHHSGKVARLLMNLMLMRSGFPPAIIHSTERQNYYEALRDGFDNLLVIVEGSLRDTMLSNIGSFEK